MNLPEIRRKLKRGDVKAIYTALSLSRTTVSECLNGRGKQDQTAAQVWEQAVILLEKREQQAQLLAGRVAHLVEN